MNSSSYGSEIVFSQLWTEASEATELSQSPSLALLLPALLCLLVLSCQRLFSITFVSRLKGAAFVAFYIVIIRIGRQADIWTSTP